MKITDNKNMYNTNKCKNYRNEHIHKYSYNKMQHQEKNLKFHIYKMSQNVYLVPVHWTNQVSSCV